MDIIHHVWCFEGGIHRWLKVTFGDWGLWGFSIGCKRTIVCVCRIFVKRTSAIVVGNEWDYVILSCVRSTTDESISKRENRESHAYIGWLRSFLGFVINGNQMNVAITRAKKGLIIIGKLERSVQGVGWSSSRILVMLVRIWLATAWQPRASFSPLTGSKLASTLWMT